MTTLIMALPKYGGSGLVLLKPRFQLLCVIGVLLLSNCGFCDVSPGIAPESSALAQLSCRQHKLGSPKFNECLKNVHEYKPTNEFGSGDQVLTCYKCFPEGDIHLNCLKFDKTQVVKCRYNKDEPVACVTLVGNRNINERGKYCGYEKAIESMKELFPSANLYSCQKDYCNGHPVRRPRPQPRHAGGHSESKSNSTGGGSTTSNTGRLCSSVGVLSGLFMLGLSVWIVIGSSTSSFFGGLKV